MDTTNFRYAAGIFIKLFTSCMIFLIKLEREAILKLYFFLPLLLDKIIYEYSMN